MGLMLSLLVVCVGVIEALSCFEHFQYGVIHCATNVYKNARRRSSVFLKYTSRRIKLLSDNSISEQGEEPEILFEPIQFCQDDFETDAESIRFNSNKRPELIKPVKKLENEDKIQIVKMLLEAPKRPKTIRSISMPELVHTEKDFELTKIINELAIEPIEEINIEIEEENPELLSKEFEKLFNEYENTLDGPESKEYSLDILTENLNGNALEMQVVGHFEEIKIGKFEGLCSLDKSEVMEKKVEIHQNYIKHDEVNVNVDDMSVQQRSSYEIPKNPIVERSKINIAQRVNKKGADYFKKAISKKGGSSRLNRCTSVDFGKIVSIMNNKPTSKDFFLKMNNDSSEDFLNKPILVESTSHDKLDEIIFEIDPPPVEVIDKTFEEIFVNILDEPLDIAVSFEEIEKNILEDTISAETEPCGKDLVYAALETHLSSPAAEVSTEVSTSKTIKNTALLKAAEQLAELLVGDSLNLNRIKNLLCGGYKQSQPEWVEIISKETEINENVTHKQIQPESKVTLEFCFSESDTLEENEKNVCSEVADEKNFSEDNTDIFTPSHNSTLKSPIQEQGNDETLTEVPLLVVKEIHKIEPSGMENGQFLDENTQSAVLDLQQTQLNDFTMNNVDALLLPEEVLGENVKTRLSENTKQSLKNEGNQNIGALKNIEPESNEEVTKPHQITDEKHCETLKGGKSNEDLTDQVLSVDQEAFQVEPEKPVAAAEFSVPTIVSPGVTENVASKHEPIAPEKRDIPVKKATTIVFNENMQMLDFKSNELFPVELDTSTVVAEVLTKKDKIEQKSINAPKPETTISTNDDVQTPKLKNKRLAMDNDKSVLATEIVTEETDSIKQSSENSQIVESGPEHRSAEPVIPFEVSEKCNTLTTPRENNQTFALKYERLLALEFQPNHEEKEAVEVKMEKFFDSKQAQSIDVPEFVNTAEVCLKLYEIPAKSEENSHFERVGLVPREKKTEALDSHSGHAAAGPIPKNTILSPNVSKNECESCEATSSSPEAFWLIFSGEYTKAMSKDWHSGHFSCWQCDEALTGQRYVLRDDHPYCIKCYESVFANVCEECNKIIGIDSKDLSYKDKHWHEACFLCNKCRVSLVDKQFGSKADKIYCGNCYDAQFASRCDGCGEIFRAGTKKMEYKTRQWHEKCFCCCVCKTPIGTKSFIPREQEIYCATCYEEKFATRCVKCNKIITSGGVTYKNEPWHRECFTCTNCNTSLAGQRFTSRDEKPYCADCFGELFAKRCTACSRPITGIGGTRFISFEDRHWHNDCFICASCKTSLVGRGFITDGDDIICPECAKQKLM